MVMMMMILHQVRHGRQDNHATNHIKCAETSRAKQSRRHIEAIRPNTARPYGESSLHVTNTTFSGLQEHRIIVYTAAGQKAKPMVHLSTESTVTGNSCKTSEACRRETTCLSIMCQWSTTPAKQSTEKAPRQCLLGKHNL
jgi:hypothetical protein